MPSKFESKGSIAKAIPLERIVRLFTYYPRVTRDWMTEAKYAAAMQQGAKFPPIHVVPRNGEYLVLDGWHRVGAAKKAGESKIKSVVYSHLPESEWFFKAVELNHANARPFTSQDRAMIANRLRKAGYDVNMIARMVSVTAAKLDQWIISRIVKDEDGTDTAIKAGTRPLVGTKHERDAIDYGGPLANANVQRTLKELRAYLQTGLVDLSQPPIRDLVLEVDMAFGALLKAAKIKRPS